MKNCFSWLYFKPPDSSGGLLFWLFCLQPIVIPVPIILGNDGQPFILFLFIQHSNDNGGAAFGYIPTKAKIKVIEQLDEQERSSLYIIIDGLFAKKKLKDTLSTALAQ